MMVRDGQPSQTARRVAAYRLAFDRVAAPFGDPAADELLAADVSAGVAVNSDGRMAKYLQYRTAFFDRVAVNALDGGCTQLVTLGAGYDARAWRYAKSGVRWFEVDHPATQADKRARLDRLGITTQPVKFVAADLVEDDAAEALLGAGFQPEVPALLLCEGLAVYLSPAVLADLFEQLRSIAAAGTRLALSGGVEGSNSARRAAFAERVARLGEPLASTRADIAEALETARWRQTEVSGPAHRLGLMVAVPV
jgi:methyltransferase (TIGR00027 family)